MKLINLIKEFFKPESYSTISISIKNGNLIYSKDAEEKNFFSFSSVLEVFAFKKDLFSYDEICVGFRISEDGTYYEIDEKMKGYDDIVKSLPNYFKGINQEWFCEVAFPAFKTNCTTIWGTSLIPKIWSI